MDRACGCGGAGLTLAAAAADTPLPTLLAEPQKAGAPS
jgi:hypothetical protein